MTQSYAHSSHDIVFLQEHYTRVAFFPSRITRSRKCEATPPVPDQFFFVEGLIRDSHSASRYQSIDNTIVQLLACQTSGQIGLMPPGLIGARDQGYAAKIIEARLGQ